MEELRVQEKNISGLPLEGDVKVLETDYLMNW